MRAIPLLLLLAAGCTPAAKGVGAAVAVASIPVIGRTPADAVVSVVTGLNCSVVRLDQGKTYCRPVDPPPAGQPFCTRSLGVVDCWANPAALNDQPPREVADGPRALTPKQDEDRTRRWPGF